jgi:hypothetical protein
MAATLSVKVGGAYGPASILVKQNGGYEAVPSPAVKVKAAREYVVPGAPPVQPTAFSSGFSIGFK